MKQAPVIYYRESHALVLQPRFHDRAIHNWLSSIQSNDCHEVSFVKVFVLLLAFVFFSGLSDESVFANETSVAVNGIAIAYTPKAHVDNYRLSASIGLPEERSNRGWYTDWIMLVSARPAALSQPFVQVGLMRWAANNFRPSFFIAYGKTATDLVYKDIRIVEDRRYVFSLSAKNGEISVFADGEQLFSMPVYSIFSENETVYGQIAGEVFTPGDQLVADIRSIELSTEQRDLDVFTPVCFRYDRGLRLTLQDGHLQGSGSFQPAAPSGFIGCEQW
jgi:hypothetical protein